MSVLERLWKDKMAVYRWEEQTINNITSSDEILVATDVKCQYSKGSLNDVGEDGAPNLVNSYTLFCGINTDIKEGDKVIVTQRNGKKITLIVGEGFPYTNHQEFNVKRSEKA
ncbi:hypothetical protein [Aminipila terrae]|uniref:Head-tail adaptor protein n=1 Tax=Aminipila terrae TaxID=2697030 RepID=A0A6P1MML1_9FIRM|nr:hypothetical protein [Aminipila terrae]QHI72896.1 hypothetical protein Ami3637_11200 [Aminipila terrae]